MNQKCGPSTSGCCNNSNVSCCAFYKHTSVTRYLVSWAGQTFIGFFTIAKILTMRIFKAVFELI